MLCFPPIPLRIMAGPVCHLPSVPVRPTPTGPWETDTYPERLAEETQRPFLSLIWEIWQRKRRDCQAILRAGANGSYCWVGEGCLEEGAGNLRFCPIWPLRGAMGPQRRKAGGGPLDAQGLRKKRPAGPELHCPSQPGSVGNLWCGLRERVNFTC